MVKQLEVSRFLQKLASDDRPASLSEDSAADDDDGATAVEVAVEAKSDKIQKVIPVDPVRSKYDMSRAGVADPWKFGDNDLECETYSMDHPILPGLKLFWSVDQSHALKCK